MSIKFKLIKKNNLGKDKDVAPQKTYASPVYYEKVSFEALLDDISEAGIPSSQVKAVIDRLNFLMRKHLAAGRIVQLGEFGNFRYSMGSSGSVDEEDFLTSQIKEPKILFTPGKMLRKAKGQTEFEKEYGASVAKEEPCERPHAD